MGWDWINDQSRVFANIGLDSPSYQGVNSVWTLRHRSCIVNGAIGGDVGVLEAITSLLGVISAVAAGISAAIASSHISKEVKTVADREKHHADPVRNTG